MGSSGPLTSTYALSIPKPLKADIKCSIVDTLYPSLIMVVAKVVAPTNEFFAGIFTAGSTSTLMKIIPVLIGAGLKVRYIFSPVCNPTPVARITFFNVF